MKNTSKLLNILLFFLTLPIKLIKIFLFSKKESLENNYYLNKNFAPVKNDQDQIEDFEIFGKIPEDLDGVFVRNGPNPKHPIKNNYHWFDGDGYLHEMELKNGKIIQYKGRFIRTKRLEMEDKAGHRLFPLLGDLINPKQFIKILFSTILEKIKNKGKETGPSGLGTANTAVEYHANRFFALVESDFPNQVVLPELETLGRYDFDGKLKHSFTAHPKVDPTTNEMLFFGYNVRQQPYLSYSVVNSEGKLIKTVPIEIGNLPYMVHDFAITENYSLFLLFPLEFNPVDLFDGKNGFELNLEKQAKLAVIPRLGDKNDIKYYNISNGYVFHTVNAWEEGNKIHLYACKSQQMSLVNLGRNLSEKKRYDPFLYKWTVDLSKQTILFDDVVDKSIPCEFPTIHPALLGRKTKFCYVANLSNSDSLMFSGISKFDFEKNVRVSNIQFDKDIYGGEFVFVPRDNSESEDDGYLMSYVHNESNKETFLLYH
eukprot:TRINITY_DN2953_c0_g2_i1.p1 TRINITY_DN2953_c0_g2~~TRINITY_DN2953_c0_g2_i1.p1  ORF type:complete len:484 (+),score=150.22 TRINITY_DN2953_c0_g2_i1:177-1628(+)